MQRRTNQCTDCEQFDRRRFIRVAGGTALAGVAAPSFFDPRFAHAAPTAKSSAESAVARLYQTLTESQTAAICLPYDHSLRRRINANWHVVEPLISENFYSKDQLALVDEILRNITSENGYERLQQQMIDDAGGLDSYSMAIFGDPATGKFQWEMTGRHLTMRADGDSVDKVAFGGPMVYGHGEEDVRENLFHYQTKRANEVFQALDAKQAARALLEKAPRETAIGTKGNRGHFPGISVGELADDQKELVRATLRDILAPYRKEDVDEAMAILNASGGLSKLHMAFYQQGDLDSDKVWDVWRLEGPALTCHFRGAPHVHAYINIGSNPNWSASKVNG